MTTEIDEGKTFRAFWESIANYTLIKQFDDSKSVERLVFDLLISLALSFLFKDGPGLIMPIQAVDLVSTSLVMISEKQENNVLYTMAEPMVLEALLVYLKEKDKSEHDVLLNYFCKKLFSRLDSEDSFNESTRGLLLELVVTLSFFRTW